MSWTYNPLLSLRENIMAHLKDRFEQVKTGVNDFETEWDVVSRAPLSRTQKGLDATVSLTDTRERKTPMIGKMDCRLTVVVEFAYRVKQGDEPETELNRLLCEVQRTMRSDITAGGCCLNIVENSSELDLEGPDDRLVGGVTFWEVSYRHKVDDPRKH